MLHTHVTSSVTLERLQSTSCSPYLDGYTNWLVARHYATATIELYLFGILPLEQWLSEHDTPVTAFDHRTLESYRRSLDAVGELRYNGRGRHCTKASFIGVRRFHEYLVSKKLVDGAPSTRSLPTLLEDFAHWMRTHKGARAVTIENHIYYLRKFIAVVGNNSEDYSARAVREYLRKVGECSSMPTSKAASNSIRVFLRYLVATDRVDSSLPDAIATIKEVKLTSIPQYIDSGKINKLIDSCASMPLTALRNRAVLLLLARLGLRASDVALLKLTDVDWHGARIRVGGKNRREYWLPLPQDVGDALADYIRIERSESSEPSLFVKSIAPIGPLTRQVVSSIVRLAIERTGIDTPSCGAHLLRHSAATEMLAHGATLGQIGSVLRHANIDTTAIYAKVDVNLLDGVATPWPENNVVPSEEIPENKSDLGELSC